jgi:hypothetical protein
MQPTQRARRLCWLRQPTKTSIPLMTLMLVHHCWFSQAKATDLPYKTSI